jgi:hypothetical protein
LPKRAHLKLALLIIGLQFIPNGIAFEAKKISTTEFARGIVRVLNGNSRGTGVIIDKPFKNGYLVLTSEHILNTSNSTICAGIDGRYFKSIALRREVNGDDLALLYVASSSWSEMPVVKVSVQKPRIGDEIVSSGFNASGTFKSQTGKLQMILQPKLKGGYDLGLTSDIEKGMSGGPTFNNNNEIIGINSMHSDPLWEADLFQQNGQVLNKNDTDKIVKLSMAIDVTQMSLGMTAKEHALASKLLPQRCPNK